MARGHEGGALLLIGQRHDSADDGAGGQNAVQNRGSRTKKGETKYPMIDVQYESVLGDVFKIIEAARQSAARTVNSIITAAYWLIGRRIVEFEQKGKARAAYGERLLQRLAQDLSARFGRGFSYPNLNKFRQFYLTYPQGRIFSTLSIESDNSILSTVSIESAPMKIRTPFGKSQMLSAESLLEMASKRFPLPWSAYVRLVSVENENARAFYETEAQSRFDAIRELGRIAKEAAVFSLESSSSGGTIPPIC
ncbi:MAG: hypothetical protein IIC50_02020 [Planctomycetes bacterium]|nr:hypothetical protein [Planctomycetota bacterium]